VTPSFFHRSASHCKPFPLNPTSPTDDKSKGSLAISKEACGVALQLSRSHRQLAITLSKSELKRLISTTPLASNRSVQYFRRAERPRATVFGQWLSARGRQRRRPFSQIDNWPKETGANTTDSVRDRRGTRNAQGQEKWNADRRLRFVKVKHTNVTLDAHQGGSQ
jgi:hypothetical protein